MRTKTQAPKPRILFCLVENFAPFGRDAEFLPLRTVLLDAEWIEPSSIPEYVRSSEHNLDRKLLATPRRSLL